MEALAVSITNNGAKSSAKESSEVEENIIDPHKDVPYTMGQLTHEVLPSNAALDLDEALSVSEDTQLGSESSHSTDSLLFAAAPHLRLFSNETATDSCKLTEEIEHFQSDPDRHTLELDLGKESSKAAENSGDGSIIVSKHQNVDRMKTSLFHTEVSSAGPASQYESSVINPGRNGFHWSPSQTLPQPSPPVLLSATQCSISLRWTDSSLYSCCYLDLAPGKPEIAVASPRVREYRNLLSPPGVESQSSTELSLQEETQWAAVYCGKECSYVVSNLKPGRRYLVRLRVIPTLSNGTEFVSPPPPSFPVVFSTLPAVPEPPGAPVLVNRSWNLLKLKWAPPQENGGLRVTEYRLYMSSTLDQAEAEGSSFSQTFVQVYAGEDLFAKIPKLSPDSKYFFRVQAENAKGLSGFSPTVSFMTSSPVPATPMPPSVQAAESTSVFLEWTEPASYGYPVSGYRLELTEVVDAKGGGGTYTPVYTGVSKSCEVRGLLSGTHYRFRVSAHNEHGRSKPSPPLDFWTGATTPLAPPAPAVSVVLAHSARVTWQPPENSGGSPVVDYELEVCHGSCEETSWVPAFRGPSLGWSLRDLRPGMPYHVRVRARNSQGLSEPSVETSFNTLPAVPESPGPPMLLDNSRSVLAVNWNPPMYDGGAPVAAYRLEMQPLEFRNDPETGFKIPIPSEGRGFMCVYLGPKLDAIVRGLRTGAPYGFRVQALNDVGPGPWSPSSILETRVGPPSVPDPPVLAFSCTAASIPLRWTPPSPNGSPILGYRLQMWTLGYGCKKLPLDGGVHPGPNSSGTGGGGDSPLEDDGDLLLVHHSPQYSSLPAPHHQYLQPSPGRQLARQAGGIGGGAHSQSFSSMDTPTMLSPVRSSPYYGPSVVQTQQQQQQQQHQGGVHPAGASGSFLAASPSSASWEVRRGERRLPDPHPNPNPNPNPNAEGGDWEGLRAGPVFEEEGGDADMLGLGMDRWQHETGSEGPSSGQSSLLQSPLLLPGGVHFDDVYHGPALAHTVTRLQPFTTYAFRLQATNKVGPSPMSPISVFTTCAAPPWAPPPPAVLDVGPDSVQLQWELPECDNGAPVTSFTLQMVRTGGAPGLDAPPEEHPSSRPLRRFSSANLHLPGGGQAMMALSSPSRSPYLKESSSSGSVSSGSGSFRAASLFRKTPGRSSSSGNLSLGFAGGGAASPGWDKYEDVYSGPATNCLVEDLLSGQKYLFRVKCRNAIGYSPGSMASVVFTEPSAPSRMLPPAASSVGPTSCRLRWSGPAFDCGAPVTGYLLSVDDGDEGQFVRIYEGHANTFKATGLLPGRTYRFYVQAINAHGISLPSDFETVTLQSASPATPGGLEFVGSTSDSVHVRWQRGGSSENSPRKGASRKAARKRQSHGDRFAMVDVREFEELEFLRGGGGGGGGGGEEAGDSSFGAQSPLRNGRLEAQFVLEMEVAREERRQFLEVYRGPDVSVLVQGLRPEQKYRFRVCSILGEGVKSLWSPIMSCSTQAALVPATSVFVSKEEVLSGPTMASEEQVAKEREESQINHAGMDRAFVGDSPITDAVDECTVVDSRPKIVDMLREAVHQSKEILVSRLERTDALQLRRLLAAGGTLLTLVIAFYTKV